MLPHASYVAQTKSGITTAGKATRHIDPLTDPYVEEILESELLEHRRDSRQICFRLRLVLDLLRTLLLHIVRLGLDLALYLCGKSQTEMRQRSGFILYCITNNSLT